MLLGGGWGYSEVTFYSFILGRLGLIFLPFLTSLMVLQRLSVDWAGWWVVALARVESTGCWHWESGMTESQQDSNFYFLFYLIIFFAAINLTCLLIKLSLKFTKCIENKRLKTFFYNYVHFLLLHSVFRRQLSALLFFELLKYFPSSLSQGVNTDGL